MNTERHNNIKLRVKLEDMRGLWVDANLSQRMELVKSIIYTAPDMHTTHRCILMMLSTDKFTETLD